MKTLTITRPDDWHVHFRDGLALEHTVAASAKYCSRALIMPNLKPALTSVATVLDYRQRILAALGNNQTFTPFMTLYLNEKIAPEELEKAKKHPFILGAKLYPAGATTNSDEGASSLLALYPLLELMQQQDLVLQIHGEVTHGDVFQREATFIKDCLVPLIRQFPKLRIVLEHISTQVAVDFVNQSPDTVAATITPHHLFYNRNHMFVGGIKPHYYCLPLLKKERDQQALQQAACSGNRKFFAGSDSAPHARTDKESDCGCAGIYSAPFAIAIYTQIFEKLGKLDKLDAFLGHFGAEFYQLPLSKEQLLLRKTPQLIPALLPLGLEQVIPIAAGETLLWSPAE